MNTSRLQGKFPFSSLQATKTFLPGPDSRSARPRSQGLADAPQFNGLACSSPVEAEFFLTSLSKNSLSSVDLRDLESEFGGLLPSNWICCWRFLCS